MSTDSQIKYNPDRVLTEAQKEINDDHHYWDWFDAWWAQDFSWGEKKDNGKSTGLAAHQIENSDQTLQDYWHEEEAEERLIPFAEKLWTRFHLPPHDRSGKEKSEKYEFILEKWKEQEWQNWRQEIIDRIFKSNLSNLLGPDNRAQFTGICFPNFFHLIDFPHVSDTKLPDNALIHLRADWVLFGEALSFSMRRFRDIADFRNSFFTNDAHFAFCEFINKAIFTSSLFMGDANFNSSHFRDGIIFNDVICLHNFYFKNADDYNAAHHKSNSTYNFARTQFLGDADFRDRVFPMGTQFVDAEFCGLALFHDCKFHQDTNFSNADFKIPGEGIGILEDFWLSVHGYEYTETEPYQRAFRTLRQLMEKNGAYAEAFKFGRLEQIAKERRITPFTWPWSKIKRRETDVPFWERQASRLYGVFANYGQDAKRPLKWIATLWALASICYWAIAQPNNEIDNGFESAMGLAFANALPPFSYAVSLFFKTEGSKLTEFEKALHESPFLTGSVMTLHAVFAATMVFFLLLALKRRFQIR